MTEVAELTDDKIHEAFQAIAGDLLAACQDAGEGDDRIPLGDAADAVFNYLQLPHTQGVFERITGVLKTLTPRGRGKYIHL